MMKLKQVAPLAGAAFVYALMFSAGAIAHSRIDASTLHRSMVVLDSHLDTPARFDDPSWRITDRHNFEDDGSQVDLPRMQDGGLDGGFWVAFTPQGALDANGYESARQHMLRRISAIHAMVDRHPEHFALAYGAHDAEQIQKSGKIVVYQSIENAYPIGEDLGGLSDLEALGVRMIGLVHMSNNQFADSANDPTGARWGGLSPAGRMLVEEANRLGLILDASHASDQTFDDILALSQTPILLSHSGCRGLFDRARNIDDDRIKRLAAKGGVIQVSSIYMTRSKPDPERDAAVAALLKWYGTYSGENRQEAFDRARNELNARYPVPRPTFDDFMHNLLYALRLVGPNHVGIGVDWDGGSDVSGFEDVSMLPKVTQRLLVEGYSPEDIGKIWGANLLRVLAVAEAHAQEKETRK